MNSVQVLVGMTVILAATGDAQITYPTAPRSPATAANTWMKTPSDVRAADDVPGGVRMERDKIWDGLIGARYALTPDEASRHGISEGSSYDRPAEIPEFPNRVVLIGTFSAYKCVLTSSTRAIYTEVTIDVSNVFEDASGRARAGGRIIVIFPGGTVKTAAGQIISYLTQPRAYFMQPNKVYLLALGYHADGDFYGFAKDWDVSDGTVRADSGIDRVREQEGNSTLIGLTRDQLIRSLSEHFLGKQ
jgi:hypothetical protein